MEKKEAERLRNIIGSIPILEDENEIGDNLSIALATYFENRTDCPDNDINDDVGWSQWAMDKTDEVLDRIIKVMISEVKC